MKLILDATSLNHRAYWIGFSKLKFKTKTGIETGGIYMFLSMLNALVKEFKPIEIWACWDKKLSYPSTNFRKEIQVEYKAQRSHDNPVFIKMYQQENFLIEILTSLGVRNMYPKVLEADDVVSWLSKKLEGPLTISSSDKDLLQLISERVSLMKGKELITKTNFEELMGVKLEHYLLYKAILGDPSDNIGGIKGFGPKKALKAASDPNEFQKLTAEQQVVINQNLKMIDLSKGYTLEVDEEATYLTQYQNLLPLKSDIPKFHLYCEQLELNRFLKKWSEWKNFGETEKNLFDL